MNLINLTVLFLFCGLVYSTNTNKFIKITWNICPSNSTSNTNKSVSLLTIQDVKLNQSLSISMDIGKKIFIIDLDCGISERLIVPFEKMTGDLYLRRKNVQNVIELSTENELILVKNKNDSCFDSDHLNETIYKIPSDDNELCFSVGYILSTNQNDGFKLKKLDNTTKCSKCAPIGIATKAVSTNQNACLGLSCLNGGKCILNSNNHTASCACNNGFSGEKCQVKKQCSGADGTNSTCGIKPFETGLTRFKRSVSLATTITTLCNPTNPCQNNGQCTLSGTTYKCTCPAGLTGTNCETIDCTKGDPCVFSKSCTTNKCDCILGFGGVLCDKLTNKCTSCLNSAACFKTYDDFICLDSLSNPKYSGKTADVLLQKCGANTCQNNPKTRCFAFIKDTIQSFSCNCPFGKTGSNCAQDTTFTIDGVSNFQHTPNSQVTKIMYKMRLRTYGPDGYLFTLKFKENPELFIGIEIKEHAIKASTATESKMMTSPNSVGTSKTVFIPTEYHLEIKSVSGVNFVCLYVRVQTVSNALQGEELCVKYSSALMTPTFILGKPNSIFNTAANSVMKARFLLSEITNSCYQDFTIDDVYTPTQSVTPNCLSVNSCVSTSCGLNSGRADNCIEYLSSKKCVCKRPFSGLECGTSPEGNLINVDPTGYMQFRYSTELLASLNEKIDVSVFVQTSTNDAVLFYFGNHGVSANDVQGFAAELNGGYISVNSKVKGQATSKLLFNDNLSWKISDKKLHLISISLVNNKLTLKLDFYNANFNKVSFSVSQTKIFSPNFLPNYVSSLSSKLGIVFFGQISSSSSAISGPGPIPNLALVPPETIVTLPNSLITKPGSIIGQFKDLEINSYKMGTDNLKFIKSMPSILTSNYCPVNKCQNGGQCVTNIFNIETCECLANYHGDLCQYTNLCLTSNPCPSSSSCVPFENKAICKGSFSIIKESTQVELSVKSSSVTFTEVRMTLKTRSINTMLFEILAQLSSTSTNVKATLRINSDGKLEGGIRNTGSDISPRATFVVTAQAINDGKTHTIVFQFSPGISIEVDSSINRASDYGKPEILPLTVPASAASLSTITIGDSTNSFLGCFEELMINNYLIGTIGSLAKDSTIFSVKSANVEMKCIGKTICLPNPCKNGASCIDQFNQFGCTCNADYEGPTCEIPKCSTVKCNTDNIDSPCAKICPSSRKECSINNTMYGCTCKKAWVGPQCDIRNPCLTPATLSNVCQNGATCDFTFNPKSTASFTCTCVNGYTGPTCNIPSIEEVKTTTTTAAPVALSSASIAGIVVGVIIGFLLIGLLIWAYMTYKYKRDRPSSYENQDNDSAGSNSRAFSITEILQKPRQEKII